MVIFYQHLLALVAHRGYLGFQTSGSGPSRLPPACPGDVAAAAGQPSTRPHVFSPRSAASVATHSGRTMRCDLELHFDE